MPATAHLVEQAGAKAAAALAMQQVLVEARELIRSSLLQVASARDEAVSAQRVLYRLTRHLFELDLSLRCCSLGALAASCPSIPACRSCVQAPEALLPQGASVSHTGPVDMTNTAALLSICRTGALTAPQERGVTAP